MITRTQYIVGVLSAMFAGTLVGDMVNFPPRLEKPPSRTECYGQGYFDGMTYQVNREMTFEVRQTNRLLRKAGQDTVAVWNPVAYDSVSPELQAVRDRSGLWGDR